MVTFHLRLLQNIGHIPSVVQYILEPMFHLIVYTFLPPPLNCYFASFSQAQTRTCIKGGPFYWVFLSCCPKCAFFFSLSPFNIMFLFL